MKVAGRAGVQKMWTKCSVSEHTVFPEKSEI